MNELLKKKMWISVLYIVCAICIEILSFLVMQMGVIPTYWGIDLGYMLLIGLLLFLIPNATASIVTGSVFLALQIAVSFVNEALKTMSGIVFGLTMLNLTKEVGGVFTSSFVNWFFLAGLLLLFGGALTGMILFHKKIKVPKKKYTRNFLILLLATSFAVGAVSSTSLGVSFASFNEVNASEDGTINYNDDHYLYRSQFISAKALRRFGTFGFYSVQISNTVNHLFTKGNLKMDEKTLASIDEYFAAGEMSLDAYGKNIYTGSLKGKNLVVIVIESGEWFAINQDYTPTLYALASQGLRFDRYYARNKTNHSEALSVLGSYPSSTAATVSELDKRYASFTLPNILSENGYTTNYFHAYEGQFYDRTTTHGGGGVYGFDNGYFLDTMDRIGTWKDGKYVPKDFYEFEKDNRMMKEYFEEYTQVAEDKEAFYTLHMSISSHGHYEDLVENGDYPFADFSDEQYYDSDMSYEEKLVKQEKLKKKFSKECDIGGFEKYYEVIDGYPEAPVDGWGITFSEDALEMDAEEKQTLYLQYKRYQAGMMDLDDGLNALMYELQQSGELDDTAFLLYSDHNSYYDGFNYLMKGVKEDNYWNTMVYNIPCMLWYGGSMNCQTTVNEGFYEGYHVLDFVATKDTASPLKKGTVDKFVNTFDLLPTVLHLMGINHNLRMYHGTSMLSDKLGSVFVSLESGIFTDDYYYDGTSVWAKKGDGWKEYDYEEMVESEEGLPNDVEAFLTSSLEYYVRQGYLDDIYKLNYYAYRSVYEEYEVDGKRFAFIKN